MRPDFRLTNPPENAVVVRGEDICFSYEDGRAIFKDASFQIRNKSRVAVVGENGAGKTTLLNLIRRKYPLDKGTIYVVPCATEILEIKNGKAIPFPGTPEEFFTRRQSP